jgi:hypothetical protein
VQCTGLVLHASILFPFQLLYKSLQEHRKQCEAALRQRERYRRKPSGYPADQVAAGVLQDEGLDPLTSGFLIRALARTGGALTLSTDTLSQG